MSAPLTTATPQAGPATPRTALDEAFARARAERRLALMLYLTVGYPTPEETVSLAALLARSGADMLELGMPFSDPFGDGLTIQHASHQALAHGITTEHCLETAEEIQRQVGIPLCLMGYLNPLLKFGVDRFCRRAAAAGVSALVVPDLPVEEAADMRAACHAHNLHLVTFLAPTSPPRRIEAAAAHAGGFIYCMSVAGVTGARTALSLDLGAFLGGVRAHTGVPLLVGFGISRPEHLRQLRGQADGVVVASALIDLMDRLPAEEREKGIGDYVASLRAACS